MKDIKLKKTVLQSLFHPPGRYEGAEPEPYALPSLIERRR